MSLVFDGVSAAGLRAVSSPPAYVIDRPSEVPAQDKQGLGGRGEGVIRAGAGGFGVGSGKPESSSESSSIGVPGGSDEEEEDGEVESNKSCGSLGALASLEESLPIKRGLSRILSGKSKSFANLAEMRTVKEIEKPEKPLNKRRRLMIAYKWSKKPVLLPSRGKQQVNAAVGLGPERRRAL